MHSDVTQGLHVWGPIPNAFHQALLLGWGGTHLNSFLVLLQLFYKNKMKLEKLIPLRAGTLQYALGKHLPSTRGKKASLTQTCVLLH